jgi:hypothetical protein
MQFDAAFPLTPALSLREREFFFPVQEWSLNGELNHNSRNLLPLPRGEVRGEGNGTVGLN